MTEVGNTAYRIASTKAYDSFKQVRNLSEEIENCVFDFEIELPKKPKDKSKICGYLCADQNKHFPYYDRKWVKKIDNMELDEIVEFPDWYCKMYRLESLRMTKTEFLHQEWGRRREGFFWYNYNEITKKTQLEYVTGTHYFMLQYWYIPTVKKTADGTYIPVRGNPRFTDMNRDWHYVASFAKKNPEADGFLFYGGRRSGKTELVNADMYFETISHEEYKSALQSKNDDDAKEVLRRIVDCWQQLPSFLKPTDTGETDVSRRLVFREPKRRSSKGEKKEYKEVLNSEIEAYPAKETTLDSQVFNYILADEVGKYTSGSASERWNVNRQALYAGAYRVGFSVLTSTVEEMEKGGGEEAKILWDGCEINEDGRPINGLLRLFFPTIYGRFGEYKGKEMVTENGYTNWEVGLKWIESQYKGKKGKDYLSIKRKHPMEWEDMFLTTDETSPFDEYKLITHKKHNKFLFEDSDPLLRGNFVWRGDVPFGEVDWIPSPNGKWERMDWNPKEIVNKKKRLGAHYAPVGKLCYSSLDPFDHMKTKDIKKSKAASHVISLHADFQVPTVVCRYLNRPTSPNIMYNDIMKQCVYYSSMLLTENNKSGIINYFEDKGHLSYLMTDPYETNDSKLVYGMATTGENKRMTLINNLMIYVYDYLGEQEGGTFNNFYFSEDLEQMVRFNPNKWTEYDSVVSLMLLVTAYMTDAQKKKTTFKDYNNNAVDSWVRVHNKNHKFGRSTI
jgi:hypothetical protein